MAHVAVQPSPTGMRAAGPTSRARSACARPVRSDGVVRQRVPRCRAIQPPTGDAAPALTDEAASAAAASDSAAAREQRIAAGAEASTSGGRDTPLSSIDWGAAGLQPVPYKLMAGLASVGAAETGYLTLSKILHSDVACPSDGCASVLSSPYAQIFGVPLPLWGMLAYGAVAALAVTADNWADATETEPPRVIDTALLAGSAVLGTASATLMYILATALDGASCIYCYTSASLSAALLACMLTSLDKRVLVDAAAPGLVTVATTAAALYISYAPALAQATGADFELPYAPPAVTAESSSRAVTLAERLHAAGAKMYGAFWCSHCFDQKQAFGKQAMAEFPYVECYPDGWKRGTPINPTCDEAGVKAFPTWVINGRAVEGELEFDQIEQALAEAEAVQAAAGALPAAAAKDAAAAAAAGAAAVDPAALAAAITPMQMGF